LEETDVPSTIKDYLTLTSDQRDRVRTAVRSLAVRSNEQYSGLLAAEAVLAARTEYPDTTRLVFTLGEDITGPTAMLVGAYNRAGELMWHIDRDGEWPDESQVTDLLAAAADWFDGHRPFTNAREDKDLDEYELPATDQPRPSQAAEADR
jgi:hypothetical protein